MRSHPERYQRQPVNDRPDINNGHEKDENQREEMGIYLIMIEDDC